MYNREEELAIIRKAQAGDTEAFSILVYRYQDGLQNLAVGMISSRDEAEDIASEAFVKAWHALRSFRNESGFKTWLWRIAINLCRSHLRRRYLQRKIFFWRDTDDEDRRGASEEIWRDTSSDADPVRSSENRNIRYIIKRARRILSPRENEVFALKYDQDLAITEIAALLSLSPNTVKVLLFRATKKIAMALKDYRK